MPTYSKTWVLHWIRASWTEARTQASSRRKYLWSTSLATARLLMISCRVKSRNRWLTTSWAEWPWQRAVGTAACMRTCWRTWLSLQASSEKETQRWSLPLESEKPLYGPHQRRWHPRHCQDESQTWVTLCLRQKEWWSLNVLRRGIAV